MADHVDITLASGKSVKVDTSDPEHTVGDFQIVFDLLGNANCGKTFGFTKLVLNQVQGSI